LESGQWGERLLDRYNQAAGFLARPRRSYWLLVAHLLGGNRLFIGDGEICGHFAAYLGHRFGIYKFRLLLLHDYNPIRAHFQIHS
jgi:hypothetical protein